MCLRLALKEIGITLIPFAVIVYTSFIVLPILIESIARTAFTLSVGILSVLIAVITLLHKEYSNLIARTHTKAYRMRKAGKLKERESQLRAMLEEPRKVLYVLNRGIILTVASLIFAVLTYTSIFDAKFPQFFQSATIASFSLLLANLSYILFRMSYRLYRRVTTAQTYIKSQATQPPAQSQKS